MPMQTSHGFRPTIAQRKRDRLRAERAIGRKLKRTEQVHHFSMTQLVICQNAKYHAHLHRLDHERRIVTDPATMDREIARNERLTAEALAETALIRGIIAQHEKAKANAR